MAAHGVLCLICLIFTLKLLKCEALVEFQTRVFRQYKHLADGGTPMQCGWISDKFGVTWQITPASLGKMMGDQSATPEQKKALMQAMMPMVKLDGSKLEEAFDSAK